MFVQHSAWAVYSTCHRCHCLAFQDEGCGVGVTRNPILNSLQLFSKYFIYSKISLQHLSKLFRGRGENSAYLYFADDMDLGDLLMGKKKGWGGGCV